jgi:K+-transporting ATPase KdpF subunit
MSLSDAVVLAIAVAVLIYLIAALLRPERF